QTDTCQAGTCTGSNPVVCNALDQCHAPGTCAPAAGTCSNPNKPDGTVCNDGNACTQTDTCQGGSCAGSNPVVCVPLDQCHTPGVCNTTTGVCSPSQLALDGATCDDGIACTTNDICRAGTCNGNAVIASGQNIPNSVAVDATSVYFT